MNWPLLLVVSITDQSTYLKKDKGPLEANMGTWNWSYLCRGVEEDAQVLDSQPLNSSGARREAQEVRFPRRWEKRKAETGLLKECFFASRSSDVFGSFTCDENRAYSVKTQF